ncbi:MULTISPECIES: hypothetical protein [unclassified Mycobacterium]|nr:MULTISPECIES: hypothetical protein [unclassified Mycobacterium]
MLGAVVEAERTERNRFAEWLFGASSDDDDTGDATLGQHRGHDDAGSKT